jgi:hypothetical protein
VVGARPGPSADIWGVRVRARFRKLAALGLTACAVWAVSRGVDAGLLDHRIKHFYKGKVLHRKPVKARPSRYEFMRPYTPEIMLTLTENHILEGWRGQDLIAEAPLTRFEATFLLGRFVRLVNSRDGRVFGRDLDGDHQAMWIPQKGWGMFEAEDALSEKLAYPTWEVGWWERPISRFQVAIEVRKVLERLAPHYELIEFYEIYPPDHIAELAMPGTPNYYAPKAAIQHGIMEPRGADFAGLSPITTHEMAVVIDRLIAVVNGYQRKPATVLPAMVPDGSDDAFPRPEEFPYAQRTYKHHIREIETEHHETIFQRPELDKEKIRDRRDDL